MKLFFPAFIKPRCSALSFQNANIRICFHSETDFTFKFRVPASILSQILVPGVEFCHEVFVGLGHGCRLWGFCPRGLSHCSSCVRIAGFCPRSFSHSSSRCSSHSFSRVRIVGFWPVVGFTCADPAFLPPSAFMYVVPNCGKSPLSSGCFTSGIPQGRHLQMPGRSWRAGKAVWRWKARRP